MKIVNLTRGYRTRRSGHRVSGLISLSVAAALLVGCAVAGEESAPSVGAGATPIPAAGGDPAALGVDEVEWPGDLDGARGLFDRMPERLQGEELRRPRYFGGAAGVTYGPMREEATPSAWVMQADGEIPDATAALSVMFGMTLACDKDTYRGTAPQGSYSGGPDVARSGDYPGTKLWWFSCRIDGADGSPNFTGHALGWASGDLGWLVTTSDHRTTAALARALVSAA